jgi:DNA-binding NarL/FixJ family response regulator
MTSLQLRAYLVEDNPVLREHLSGALEELTCVSIVGACGTQTEAQAWLSGNTGGWDLLIVDLFLKSGSGMQLVEQLTRDGLNQKVIILSNYVNPSVRKRCAQLGVDAVFDKSTEIDGLVDYCALQCSTPRGDAWSG